MKRCRPRPARHCDCGGEVSSAPSPCARRSSLESAHESGGSMPARYPAQNRESRDGRSGAKDPAADRTAKSRRLRFPAALRSPSALPVHRHPECAVIPCGPLPHSAAKEIRATDGTSDSTTSSAGSDDGVRCGAQLCAGLWPRSRQRARCTALPVKPDGLGDEVALVAQVVLVICCRTGARNRWDILSHAVKRSNRSFQSRALRPCHTGNSRLWLPLDYLSFPQRASSLIDACGTPSSPRGESALMYHGASYLALDRYKIGLPCYGAVTKISNEKVNE